jgi:fructokinase
MECRMNGKKTVVGLGELLWDLLPAGERLGGAPANFTVMTARLGNRGVVASRLGADMRGDLARGVLKNFLVDLAFLQTAPRADLDQPTGTVGVEIAGGEPRYVIHAPAAWDFLAWTADWRSLAAESDAVCFGTLAQRERLSRNTIGRFLRATRPECVRVFDVNLRAPFFSAEIIAESLQLATIFKLNQDEVSTVLQMLGAPAKTASVRAETDLPRAAAWLMARYPMQMVAITLGAEGSLLVTRDAVHRHPGVATRVVDTVGSGDAFTAALVDAYLRGATLAAMSDAANRWGARVASQPGAMLELDAASRADLAVRL